MEFICVLSVGGSLASYQVRKEEMDKYTAVLKTNSGKRDDLPGEIRLKKKREWVAWRTLAPGNRYRTWACY
jgi:hypothetical protein